MIQPKGDFAIQTETKPLSLFAVWMLHFFIAIKISPLLYCHQNLTSSFWARYQYQ
jgi:hypothetical protein